MRHASVTFDPAASACDMPALLSTQRPRHATCQRHFRPSGLGMRHASVTFDPAAPACDMPASLLIQRPRQLSCQLTFDPADWQQSCRQGPYFIYEIVARLFSMRGSNRVGFIGPKWPMLFAYREIRSGSQPGRRRSSPDRQCAAAHGRRRNDRKHRARCWPPRVRR